MSKPLSAFAARKAAQKAQSPKASISPKQKASSISVNQTTEPTHRKVQDRPKKRKLMDIDRSSPASNGHRARRNVVIQAAEPLADPRGHKKSGESNLIVADERLSGTDINATYENDNDESGSGSDILSRQSVHSSIQLSFFSETAKATSTHERGHWQISLGRKDKLAIIGQYDIWVRQGVVSIYGAILQASHKLYRVYAPSSHAIPVLKVIPNPYDVEGQTADIEIRSCTSGIRALKHLSPKFGRIWNASTTKGNLKMIKPLTYVNLESSCEDSYQRALQPLEIPLHLTDIIGRLKSDVTSGHVPSVLVCGPKGSGKSTTCRMLVNSMLTTHSSSSGQDSRESRSVYLLDLDPGQPEHGHPGDMSLREIHVPILGPAFTHPDDPGQIPVRLHNIGSMTPRDDPRHFMECVKNLLSRLPAESRTPLIVNTPGWIQGQGLDIICQLLTMQKMSEVIYTSTEGPHETVEAIHGICTLQESTFYQIPSQSGPMSGRSASDLRMMQSLSYFHTKEAEAGNVMWNSKPLNLHPPLIVPYSRPQQGIFAVIITGDAPDPDLLAVMLEGTIVSIVVVDDDIAIDDYLKAEGPIDPDTDMTATKDQLSSQAQTTPPHLRHPTVRRSNVDIPFLTSSRVQTHPLPPQHTHCIGQGLIHSIDVQRSHLTLYTPAPSEIIHAISKKQKIILVRGRLEPPAWAYKEHIEYQRSLIDDSDDRTIQELINDQPWISQAETQWTGAKTRRIRRDIRYHNTNGGDSLA